MHPRRLTAPHWAYQHLADLEAITSAWVHWYNTGRLMHRLGRRPPAEADYCAQYDESQSAAAHT
jgi:putative transposase